MPAPTKRYSTERIIRGTVNGETVNQGILLWFRDRESLELVAEAVAQQNGYYSDQEMVDGVMVRQYQDLNVVQFLQLSIRRWMRDAVLKYRRANAETALVTAELPELPDV
jgi:hypothetical protein